MAMCEIYVFIDENGDYGVGKNTVDAKSSYDCDIGGQSGPMRMVKLALQVAEPVVEEFAGDVLLGATKGVIALTALS